MSNGDHYDNRPPARRKAVGEWFWRFLATVMLFSMAWVLWIFYQLNPPALATAAAFAAADKARTNQNTSGVIGGKPAGEAPKPEPAVAKESKEPPVNTDKLKLSDSISEPK